MQYSQTGERFFCQSKPKFRRTAYTSVKDFMTNEGKQIEPVLGSAFSEVPLRQIMKSGKHKNTKAVEPMQLRVI